MFRKQLHDRRRLGGLPTTAGYTLVELLIVITIMGIFVGLVLTRFEPSFHDQLQGTAQVVTSDLALARSLAVANNSQYRITFDTSRHRYWLEHAGSNSTLNTLPESPYRDPTDPPTRHTTNLRKLPSISTQLELVAVRNVATSSEVEAASIEFTSLGALNQTADCWIWLALGRGDARRYLPIELDSITGLPKIGTLQVSGPPPLPANSPPVTGS